MTTLYDQTTSYMRLGLHLDGKNTVWLRVPTFWDDDANIWIGAVQTPETKHLISAKGKTSPDLEQSFNKALKAAFESEIGQEVFQMFKPEEY